MDELIAWILVFFAVLIGCTFALKWVVAGTFWVLVMLGWGSYCTLDQLFSAQLIPAAPWVMWVLAGALIGGALGFWTMAPIYGLRRRRAQIAAAPFVLLALIAIVRLLVTRG